MASAPHENPYSAAGVDTAAGDLAVELMKSAVRRTHGPEVLGGVGGFAGLFDATLAGFFAGAIRYVVLILVIVMVLGQFGVQTASILAALGAAGLAIGLALQGTLQNIAAGIMLLVLRPFRVGEYIETSSVWLCA